MDDLISRRAAIEAIKTWGLLIDGLSEGQATEILSKSEVEKILKTKICTYRETGCGSCPYKAESEEQAN